MHSSIGQGSYGLSDDEGFVCVANFGRQTTGLKENERISGRSTTW
jgi:hypothetical protein